MAELVDIVSGIRYRKPLNPIVVEELERLDEGDTLSLRDDVCSLYTVLTKYKKEPVRLLSKPRPGGSCNEWLKHMSSDWNDDCKLRQIIIWMAEAMLEEERAVLGDTGHSSTERTKEAFIEKLKTSDDGFSSFRRRPLHEIFRAPRVIVPEEHPDNVRNKRILEEYQRDISIVQEELNRWEKCEHDMYERHTKAMDNLCYAKEHSNSQVRDQDRSFLKDIEKNQREYVEKLLSHHLTDPLQPEEIYSKFPFETAEFRKKINIVNALNERIGKVADNVKMELAQTLYENSRIVPIDADERVSGLFENDKEQRKASETLNLELLLKHLSS